MKTIFAFVFAFSLTGCAGFVGALSPGFAQLAFGAIAGPTIAWEATKKVTEENKKLAKNKTP